MVKPILCTFVADLGWLVIAASDGPWDVVGILITTFGGIALAYLQLKSLAASKAAVVEARAAVVVGKEAVVKGEEAVAKVGEVHDEVKVVKGEVEAVKGGVDKSVKMLNGQTLAIQKQLAISTATVARDHPDDTEAAAAAIEAKKNYLDHLAASAEVEKKSTA